MIPQSTEDIREYMLQIVLPSADVMTSHGQDHPDMALPSMKELIDDMGYPLPDSDDMALGINQIPKGDS